MTLSLLHCLAKPENPSWGACADVHNAYTTVQEALEFSARLRIAGASKDIIHAFVDEIMDLVELTSLRELVVQQHALRSCRVHGFEGT